MPYDFNNIPELAHPITPRPRLTALLDAAFQKPFVVINADAGFGKTTAVSQYLSTDDRRTVWFSFEESDNAPTRFWDHLTQVFAQHRHSLGEKMRIIGFPLTLQAFGLFLTDLTEELYQDDQTVAFVFDDVHRLNDPAVLLFLTNLISTRLENSNVVLITRVWPLPIQPTGTIPQIIGAADLRFSIEETKEYISDTGLTLNHEEISKLHQYVSGWPIALSLVALSLKRGDLAKVGESALSTTKPALFALFEREIFSVYTSDEQNTLIKLAALDSFPKELAQTIAGEQERELGLLPGSGIFVRHDPETMWFSFHPMYQEFLREKLIGLKKTELDETYLLAANWFDKNGHYYEAAKYYKQCGKYAELWETLQRVDAIRRGKYDAEFIIEQIRELPDDFRRQNPMTYMVTATQLMNNLRFDEAKETLDEVQNLLEKSKNNTSAKQLLGEYHIARGLLLIAMEQNGFEVHFKQASKLLPEGSSRWNNKLQLIDLGPGLHLGSSKAGELEKTLACFSEGVPYMTRTMHGAGAGLDKLCECEALFLTGNYKKAIEPAHQALYAAQALSQYDIAGNALLILLRIYLASGDYEQISDTMEHVHRYETDKDSQPLGIWDIIHGWLFTEMNDVEKVALWIRNPIQKGFAPVSISRAIIVRLRCLIITGQYYEALALLEQFEALEKIKGSVLTRLYIQIGWAITYSSLGMHDESMNALQKAYELANGNRLIAPFIEYGKRSRTLFDHAKQSGAHKIPAKWLDELYAKSNTYAKRHAFLLGKYKQEQEGHSTDYALSPRETELLTNLSLGFTREEIAEAMDLSINTVKSITKQVFAKLGAINAPDAVRIAIINRLI